jgi:hypothetical protein
MLAKRNVEESFRFHGALRVLIDWLIRHYKNERFRRRKADPGQKHDCGVAHDHAYGRRAESRARRGGQRRRRAELVLRRERHGRF